MIADECATSGLSGQEAAERLAREGFNELPARRRRTLARIALETLREPMFLFLLAAGAVYMALGEPQDAAMLLGFVVITMGITVFQERKTERVLEALRDLSSPRALVMRDGRQVRIPGREVVRGDLLVLEEGDRVAADGLLIESHDLLIDESLLTGESIAAPKSARMAENGDASGGEHCVYSGSLVVQGGGLARITSTGAATQLGRIGRIAETLAPEKSSLQREIAVLVKRFSLLGVAISLLVFWVYGWTRGDWLNGFLAGITLAMSILPEEFTVILTVFMALGAWRISKSRVLTRHMPVIETLGSATVLCVDKTGTLTENRMSVAAVVVGHQRFSIGEKPEAEPPEAARPLLEYAVLASEISPFDPMEKAFHRCLDEFFPEERSRHRGWELVHDYALSSEWMAMTHAWRAPGAAGHIVATKGAPEAVIRLCRLDERETARVLQQVQELAAQGIRVLAVAGATHSGDDWPSTPAGFAFEWIGLAGLADPLRPEAKQSIDECRRAGIRVVMITGDFPATAQAIARQAGLPWEKAVTGAQLDALDDAALAAALRDTHVFARVLPEQKLRLVQGFKANGEVVGMTGDGVNDVPALKASHIAISMGSRGTDVAREASSLVLLNDDFSSIVRAVRLGRRIYDNLRKALVFVVAVHIPIAGMALFPILLGAPPAFAPIHIVFLEMIINPSCALVFEAEHAEREIMSHPPRKSGEPLLGARSLVLAVLQGSGLLVAVAWAFFHAISSGASPGNARALAFTAVVIGSLGLIVASRSSAENVLYLARKPNPAQWWVIVISLCALLSAIYFDPLRTAFHFSPVGHGSLLQAVAAGAAAIAWFELIKKAVARSGAGRRAAA